MQCLAEAVVAQGPQHEYLLILPPDAEDLIQAETANVTKLCSRLKYYSLREQIQLPRILRQHRIDLLHSPHFMLPLLRPCPMDTSRAAPG